MLNRMEDLYNTMKTLIVNTPLDQIPGLPLRTAIDTFLRVSKAHIISA
jgi:hypothetical protein